MPSFNEITYDKCPTCNKQVKKGRKYCNRKCYSVVLSKRNSSQKKGIKINCSYCNSELIRTPYKIKAFDKHFCNLKCKGLDLSKTNTGKDRRGFPPKLKMICKKCGVEFEIIPALVKDGGGIYCSMNCYNAAKKTTILGSNNPNWKGGITKTSIAIRSSFENRQWRSDVFQRDNYTCQECGVKGVYLHAHHVKSFSTIVNEYNIKTMEDARNCMELWNINNGRTLCVECHDKKRMNGEELSKLHLKNSNIEFFKN
jgi:endogenous inhibitor of DNA gyrase (YacG/DUF329 family)